MSNRNYKWEQSDPFNHNIWNIFNIFKQFFVFAQYVIHFQTEDKGYKHLLWVA